MPGANTVKGIDTELEEIATGNAHDRANVGEALKRNEKVTVNLNLEPSLD